MILKSRAVQRERPGPRLPLTVLQCCFLVATNHCHPASSTPVSAHVVSEFCKESLSLLTFSLRQRKKLWLDSKTERKTSLMVNNTVCHGAFGSPGWAKWMPKSILHFNIFRPLSARTNQSINYCMCSFSFVFSLEQ